MKTNSLSRKIASASALILLATTLVRCGDEHPKKKPHPEAKEEGQPVAGAPDEKPDEDKDTPTVVPAKQNPEAEAPPTASEPAPRTFTEAELMKLAGLSAIDSQTKVGECKDILANGLYNRYKETLSDTIKYALFQDLCALDEGAFADKVYQFYDEREGGSSSGTHAGGFEFNYMQVIGLKLNESGGGSSSSSQQITREQATESAHNWRKLNCESGSSAGGSQLEHAVVSEQIDKNIVDAWRACTTTARNGLFCESQETDETVTINLKWDPNATQALLLPRLNLKQQTAANLELISDSVPETLGTGTGISITYRRVDPDKSSTFGAIGSDPHKQVNFSCSLQMSKVVRGTIKEDKSCGILEIHEGRGQVCGDPTFPKERGAVCGVEKYIEKRSSLCEVELYKMGAHPSCPGSVSADVQTKVEAASSCSENLSDPDDCPSGYIDEGIATETKTCRGRMDADWQHVIKKTRTCRRAEFLAQCRHPSFGVAKWKSCRKPGHGPETFKECHHASFTPWTYPKCRNEAFGVTHNTCFVPD